MPITEQAVLDVLKTVEDPDLHKDFVSLNMVKKVEVKGDAVHVVIELTTPACPVKEEIRKEVEEAIKQKTGARSVQVEMTAQVRSSLPDSKALAKIKNIVGCGSGKGGVGKSTVSVNLALALAEKGSRVGLLDADIYGPNVPGMLGIQGRPNLQVENGKILPFEKHGLKVLSMGFLLEEGNPVIWRGPMLHGIIKQFLFECEWGELDYLVIDLPPGTGDVQLTLSQLVPMTGVVIVSTPQDVALQDVRKAIAMFQKTQVPILGLVENMSHFLCPKCGERSEIFSHGGAQKEAAKFHIPFLGEIPLKLAIREGGDKGAPVVLNAPQSPEADAFRHVAGEAARQISIRAFEKKPVFNFSQAASVP